MRFFSLRTKITALNIASLCAVCWLAYTGNQSIERVLHLTELDWVNKLVQKHMESDMLHDAIDSDVVKSLNALHRKDPEEIQTVKQELAEHVVRLNENQQGIKALPLPDAIRALTDPLAEKFERYAAMATLMLERVEQDTRDNTTLAEAQHPEFQALFKDIEGSMENASDQIEQWSAKIKDDGIQSAAEGRKQLELIAIGAVALMLFFSVYISLALFRPQKKLLTIAERLLANDLEMTIPYHRRHDEMGSFSRLLLAMQKAAKDKAGIADAFEHKVKSIVDIVASAASEMGANASSVSENIGRNTKKITELNHNMRKTSSNIQAVASAVGQLAASGSEIHQQVLQSGRINSSAVEESNTVKNISHELAQSIQAIGDITHIITTITKQINLLSLNATIEAARAGDAGKGFAVVAAEVKGLASETAKSADDITAQVGIIQATAGKTLNGMHNITAVIQQIDHVSGAIAAAIQEQGQATESITRNIEEAARYSNAIAEHVESVSTMADNSGRDAEEMKKASANLAEQAENLRREVDDFLASMRRQAA